MMNPNPAGEKEEAPGIHAAVSGESSGIFEGKELAYCPKCETVLRLKRNKTRALIACCRSCGYHRPVTGTGVVATSKIEHDRDGKTMVLERPVNQDKAVVEADREAHEWLKLNH